MNSLEDRIGVSTLCMPRIPIEQAIGRIRQACFRAIEFVPVKVEHDPHVDGGDGVGKMQPIAGLRALRVGFGRDAS